MIHGLRTGRRAAVRAARSRNPARRPRCAGSAFAGLLRLSCHRGRNRPATSGIARRLRAAPASGRRHGGEGQRPAARPAQPKAKAATPRGRAVRAALVLAAVAAAAAIVLLSRRWTEPPSRPTASDLLKPLAGLNFPPEELTPRPRPEAPPAEKLAIGDSVETKAGEKRRFALPDGSVLYVNENTKVQPRRRPARDADRRHGVRRGVTASAGPGRIDVRGGAGRPGVWRWERSMRSRPASIGPAPSSRRDE